MIPRYSRPEMAAIWSEGARLRLWQEIEVLVCEVRAELGEIPAEDARTIRARAAVDADQVREREEVTQHDVAAFVDVLSAAIGPVSHHVHWGLTSSDVLDTALAVQLAESGLLLVRGLDALRDVLRRRAEEFRAVPMAGRTHGMHAEPTTFGLKLLLAYSELGRARARLVAASHEVSTGKLSGAVGTFAHLSPEVERRVCEALGLRPEAIATQVIGRDRHAAFLSSLAILGASLERLALEVRHLQRTEVREVEEQFDKARPAPRRCRTSAIRSSRADLRAGACSCARTRTPASRTSRCGTSATSPTRRSSASSCRTAASRLDYLLDIRRRAARGTSWSIPENMRDEPGPDARAPVLAEPAARPRARGADARRGVPSSCSGGRRVWDERLTFREAVLSDPDVARGDRRGGRGRGTFARSVALRNVDRVFDRLGIGGRRRSLPADPGSTDVPPGTGASWSSPPVRRPGACAVRAARAALHAGGGALHLASGAIRPLLEAHLFNTMWSEHCSYKSTKPLLKKHLPTSSPFVILGPVEDAGVVDVGEHDGRRWAGVIGHESHNHPSQVVPYEGAATGIGGIVRDVYCMGADVFGVMDSLRFGDLDGPNAERCREIMAGVVEGIAGLRRTRSASRTWAARPSSIPGTTTTAS